MFTVRDQATVLTLRTPAIALSVAAASFAALLQCLQAPVKPVPHPLGAAVLLFALSLVLGLATAYANDQREASLSKGGEPSRGVRRVVVLLMSTMTSFALAVAAMLAHLYPLSVLVYVVGSLAAACLLHSLVPDRSD